MKSTNKEINRLSWNRLALLLIPLLQQTLVMEVCAEDVQRIAYAVFNSENQTLTFSYGSQKPEKAYGMSVVRKGDDYERRPEWIGIAKNVKTVMFDSSFADALTTARRGLQKCGILKTFRDSKTSIPAAFVLWALCLPHARVSKQSTSPISTHAM